MDRSKIEVYKKTSESTKNVPPEKLTRPKDILIFLRNELGSDNDYMTKLVEAYKKAQGGNPEELKKMYEKFLNINVGRHV